MEGQTETVVTDSGKVVNLIVVMVKEFLFSCFLFLNYEIISLAESVCVHVSLGHSCAEGLRGEKLKVHFGK